jgi:hypothetical protein
VDDDAIDLQASVIREWIFQLLTREDPQRKPARPMNEIERQAISFQDRQTRYQDLAKRIDRKAGNFYTSYMEQVIRSTNAGKDPLSIRPKGTKPGGGLRYPQIVRNMRLEMLEGFRLGRNDFKTEAARLAGKEKRILPPDEESFTITLEPESGSIERYEISSIFDGLSWLMYDKDFQASPRKGRTKLPTEQQILDQLEEELDARLHLGVQKIQNEANIALTRVKRRGLIGREKLSFITNQVARVSEPTLRAAVREALNISYGEGRETEQFKLNPERLVRSAVFDGNICEICAEKDGVVFRSGDPRFDEIPDPECLGGSRCRCINIPLAAGDLPGPQAVARAVTDRPDTVAGLEESAARARRRLQVLEQGAIGQARSQT